MENYVVVYTGYDWVKKFIVVAYDEKGARQKVVSSNKDLDPNLITEIKILPKKTIKHKALSFVVRQVPLTVMLACIYFIFNPILAARISSFGFLDSVGQRYITSTYIVLVLVYLTASAFYIGNYYRKKVQLKNS